MQEAMESNNVCRRSSVQDSRLDDADIDLSIDNDNAASDNDNNAVSREPDIDVWTTSNNFYYIAALDAAERA